MPIRCPQGLNRESCAELSKSGTVPAAVVLFNPLQGGLEFHWKREGSNPEKSQKTCLYFAIVKPSGSKVVVLLPNISVYTVEGALDLNCV